MALNDPQSLKIGSAAAISLPRVSSAGSTATYQVPDGTVAINVKHKLSSSKKRAQRLARVDHAKVIPDPFTTTVNTQASMAAYIVVDAPINGGYSIAEQQAIVQSLTALLNDAAWATKFLGGES